MKRLDLGQTITILANLGVIAGIALLAVELGQNNDLLSTQVRSERSVRATAFTEEIFRNSELAGVLAKASDDVALNRPEQLQLDAFILRALRIWEWQYREFLAGTITEAELGIAIKRGLFRGDEFLTGIDVFWSREKERYFPADFIQWMEEEVVSGAGE